MLTKIVLRKTTSSIFLAIVLVLGTITLMHPSFIGAQAESDDDYESENENNVIRMEDNDDDESSDDEEEAKDNDDESDNDDNNLNENNNDEIKEVSYVSDNNNNNYYKSKDGSSSVSIKKIKCNNINVNLNGINANIGLPFNDGPVTGPISEAQALESKSFESNSEDRQSGSDTNSRIVCINNNNNIVVGEEPPEPLSCEECFTENLDEAQEERLSAVLSSLLEIEDLEGLCELLSTTTIPNDEIVEGLILLLFIAEITDEDTILDILECLEELELVIVPEELPIPLPES